MVKQSGTVTIDGEFRETHLLDRVAITGKTTCSEEETFLAYQLGYQTVRKGKWVVCAISKGVERGAVLGALRACEEGYSGGIIGIVSCFFPNMYPIEHKKLYEQVKKYGYLIYPFDNTVRHSEVYLKKAKTVLNYVDNRPLMIDIGHLFGELCGEVHVICQSNELDTNSAYALKQAYNKANMTYHWKSACCLHKDIYLPTMQSVDEPICDVETVKDFIEGNW